MQTSRFSRLPRWAAGAVLALLASLMVLGLLARPPSSGSEPVSDEGDLALYRAVVARVHAGEPYEHAAVAEHRERGYPLKPFVAVRPPFLGVALAKLPDLRIADALLDLLALSAVAAWTIRLRRISERPLWLTVCALSLLAGCGSVFGAEGASLLHETWAGLLIALSLAVRSEKRFLAAVLIALLAALIRELALPFVAAMSVLAAWERRWKEAGAFAAAAVVALAALAWHAQALGQLLVPSDPASPGWVKFGGWTFVLSAMQWNLIVLAAGGTAAAFIAPLALLGAAGWKGSAGARLALVLFGYLAAFTAVGRPDNLYWGLMIAPLMAVGLALSAPALADLISRSITKRPT